MNDTTDISMCDLPVKYCILCNGPTTEDNPVVVLTQKGCDRITDSAKERKSDIVSVAVGDAVHVRCRREFTNKKQIQQDLKRSAEVSDGLLDSSMSLRSSSEHNFEINHICLYCGHGDTSNDKHQWQRSKSHKLISVVTLEFLETLQKTMQNRNDDDWTFQILTRIGTLHDLPAAEAKYHDQCRSNYHTGKKIPQCFDDISDALTPRKRGRTPNEMRERAFAMVMEELKVSTDETVTVHDLISSMEIHLGDSTYEPYGFTHMKQKLKAWYGNEVTISEVDGKGNVVTFTSNAAKIIHNFHMQKNTNEKENIIKAAAKLIECDIKSMTQDKSVYPDIASLSTKDLLQYLPDSLRLFITTVLPSNTNDIKVASLGHALTQATRPRALLSPLQLGLAVQVHHQFASRFLNDTLSRLGFCSSYAETQAFERNAAQASGTTSAIDVNDVGPGHCVQYMLDNADHNTRTIDGRGTFHGMGMMYSVTPSVRRSRIIPRVRVNDDDLHAIGGVRILPYHNNNDNMRHLLFTSLPHISPMDKVYDHIDTAWKASGTCGYSGLMQMVMKDAHPGKSSLLFLPMIDMNPSDPTCIYSSLLYVSSHARRFGVTPVITFDQPLWWKALTIIENEPSDSNLRQIVLKIGVFHLQMSFLGSIGFLMENTGLRHLIELAYGDNVVPHIMSGKAYERATRAHQLVNGALNVLLEKQSLEMNILSEEDVSSARQIVHKLRECMIETNHPSVTSVMSNYSDKLSQTKKLLDTNRTSKLWLLYMDLHDISRYIQGSERTGDWMRHLSSVQKALPVLAASGHNLYAKTCQVYLQRMTTLEQTHPNVHRHFMQGLHVVRKSDRLWAGMSGDHTIETTLMRSLKTAGGLSRGRGFTEAQTLVWLMSRAICLEINDKMQQLTMAEYQTTDQHKESTSSRINRDSADVAAMVQFLQNRNPFKTKELMNISTGVIAQYGVNCDDAISIGNTIINGMIETNVLNYTFKRSARAKNMNTNIIKIGDHDVNIDPLTLFQRFVAIGTDVQHTELFSHELCSYPSALFSSRKSMLVADKPALADGLWDRLPSELKLSPHILLEEESFHYVIDGGWLIHKISWVKGESFGDICQKYITFVGKSYGDSVTICFDGYGAISTKDSVHAVRTGNRGATEVSVQDHCILDIRKEDFLSNDSNKQKLIDMLSFRLREYGIQVINAESDADTLIAKTAMQQSGTNDTILIGSDTDLLILLLYNYSFSNHKLYYCPVTRTNTKKAPRLWDIKLCREALGDLCNNLLFAHAFLGCDTTSRVFGIGKASILTDLKSMNDEANVFHSKESTALDVVAAGEKVLIRLFGVNKKNKITLDQLRHTKFITKVKSGSIVNPRSLPPTSDAAKYHSLRAYHQVQEWKGNRLAPSEWGWSVQNGSCSPITTQRPIAPEQLMTLIKCGCKGDCSTKRCSCRKNGIDCDVACSCNSDCCNVTIMNQD